jgi:hypothetical protein
MSTDEPLHDPVDLLDEADAIIREQELLRLRVIALQARYRALEVHAGSGRFDKLDESGWREEFGSVNVKFAAIRLGDAADDMSSTLQYHLLPVRELAEKVREYPRSESEQADAPNLASAGSGSALAQYRPGQALADRGEIDEERSL